MTKENRDLFLLIISSPSGAGKTTLTRDLLKRFPDMSFSISYTTRKPRPQEKADVDYHFIDRGQFEELKMAGVFAEWAEVHGNYYGTSLQEIEKCRVSGKLGMLFDIDYQGARQLKKTLPSAVSVFVLPPSMSELKARLRRRAAEDEHTIERRFQNAKLELEHYGLFDYVIVNDDLQQALTLMCSIVHAELSRASRMKRTVLRLLQEVKGD